MDQQSPITRPSRPSMGITCSQRKCPGSSASNAGTNITSQIPPRLFASGDCILRERNQRSAQHRGKDRQQKGSDAEELQQHPRCRRRRRRSSCGRRGRRSTRRRCSRGIERRIGGEREEEEERRDAQQESDQLIQPPVARGNKDACQKPMWAVFTPDAKLSGDAQIGQSPTIMPRSGFDNQGNTP
jgi:hypothetical protein